MKDDFDTRLLSKLPDSLVRLYRTGGVMLVLIFVGISCMAWAHFHSGQLSTPLFIVGAVLTVTCLLLYVWTQLKEPLAVRRDARISAAVENLALELTKTVDAFQSLGFKHLKFTEVVFGEAARTLAQLPRLESEIRKLGISNPREIPHLIADVSTLSKKAIDEIRNALSKKDTKNLMQQAKALAAIRQKINRVLSPPELFADLIKAVSDQNIAKVQYMVEFGAPLDIMDSPDGETPLTAAVLVGNMAIVRLLLAAGADPDARGPQNRTVLMLSVQKSQPEIMRALLDANANVDLADKSGRTALMWAADTGNLFATQLLLNAKADVEREDHSQLTALARAQKNKFPAIANALKAAGSTR